MDGQYGDSLKSYVDEKNGEIVMFKVGATSDGRLIKEEVSRRPMSDEEIKKYRNESADYALRTYSEAIREDEYKRREEEAKEKYLQMQKEKEKEEIERIRQEKEAEAKKEEERRYSGDISKISTSALQSKHAIELMDSISKTYERFMEGKETNRDELHVGLINGEWTERDQGFRKEIKDAAAKKQITDAEKGRLLNAVRDLQTVIQSKYENSRWTPEGLVSKRKNPYLYGENLEERIEIMEKLRKAKEKYNSMNLLQKKIDKKLGLAIANQQLRQITGEAYDADNIDVYMGGRRRL